MKKFLLLVVWVFIFSTIHSQIAFKDNNCSALLNNTVVLANETPFYFNVFNGNSNAINYSLEIVQLSLPIGYQYLTICANNTCYIIDRPRVLVENGTIASNSCSSDAEDIEYSNGNANQLFSIKLKATNLNNPNDTAVITFVYPDPSVTNTKSFNFNIYPNPTHRYITIENIEFPITQVRIYNSAGQKVYEGIIDKTMTIDIGHLPSGTYNIIVNNFTHRFIKLD